MPWGYKPTSPSVHWARPQKSLFLTGHIISHIFLINQPLTWPIGQWISIYKIWLKMIVFSDVHGCSWNHVRPLILKKKSNHRKKKTVSHMKNKCDSPLVFLSLQCFGAGITTRGHWPPEDKVDPGHVVVALMASLQARDAGTSSWTMPCWCHSG
jgi:hypothetical protein